MKKLFAIFVAVTTALIISISAAAAPTNYNISIAAGSDLSFQGSVTFDTSYGKVKNPRIEVLCYQNGSLVYGEAGSPYNVFVLGGNSSHGSIWVENGGGPADCVANLYYFKNGATVETVYLTSVSFSVTG